MKLRGKIALVTGAGTGIGKAIALGLARAGADVIVNYFTHEDSACRLREEIKALGRRSLALQADISQVSQIQALFRQTQQTFGALDILVNNAGVTGWTDIFHVTESQWDTIINTNLKGAFFCALEAAKMMRANGGGSIINVSTNCAELGVKNLAVYAISKGGIHAMTRQLAVELAPYNIRVNTFAPGPTRVERNLRDDPDYDRTWGAMVPLGRTADPEEMIGPTLFLASDDSSYMTGQVFFVDGGWTVAGKIPEAHMDQTLAKHSEIESDDGF